MRHEDMLEKEKKRAKQRELRQVMDLDCKEKRDYRDRNSAMQKRTDDFSENNVLSYMYTQKEHKSYTLDKKKQHMINLMQSQFQSTDRLKSHEDRTYLRDAEYINKRDENIAMQKLNEKKRKEMEAKLIQDHQVMEKNKLRELTQAQKLKDAKTIEEDVIAFRQEEAGKKIAHIQKNKDHLDLVMRQMKEKSKQNPGTFAKTGVAIIKGSTPT